MLPGLPARLLDNNVTGHHADYHHPDPDAIVSRQLAMLDIAQQTLRVEMTQGLGHGDGSRISLQDITKLERMSSTIVRAVDALKRSGELARTLEANMTPQQALEMALRKVEGQDVATLRYAIRRLKAYLEKLDPKNVAVAQADTASAAIAALEA